jgi:hypothetical protein
LAAITWDAIGTRVYQSGVDRGVLYIGDQPGVPWSGLNSVVENISGGAARPLYVDGDKYSNLSTPEEYDAQLSAYTYPDEFEVCDGNAIVRSGFLATRQKRQPFSLSYRTFIGNDLTGSLGYRIHLVYNVLASPSIRSYKTDTTTVSANDFSWHLTALPPATSGYNRTAHYILDSRELSEPVLTYMEQALYGTDVTPPRLPSFTEIISAVDSNGGLTVTDNGDGTFTMTAPDGALFMLDSNTAQLTWSSAVYIDADTYTVSTASI